VRKVFGDAVFAKTSELLLYCGPVGCYFMGLTNISTHFKKLFCKLFRLLHLARSKSSTAGDREELTIELPVVMTELELGLPLSWNTPVMHFITCSTVTTLLDCGIRTKYTCVRPTYASEHLRVRSYVVIYPPPPPTPTPPFRPFPTHARY